MAEGADPDRLIRPPLRQKGVEGLAALEPQLLLLQQQIDGENKGDKSGADGAEHPHSGGNGGRNYAAHAGGQKVPQILRKLRPVDGQVFQPAGDLGIGCELLLRPDGKPSCGGGYIAAQAGDALRQLGHDHQHQQQYD